MRDRLLHSLPTWAGLLVPTYKVLLSLSLLIGCWWIVRRLRARGWEDSTALSALLWAIGASLVGARAGYLLQFGPRALLDPPTVLDITSGGFSLLGSLLGASVAAFLYLKRAGASHAVFADACAPAMALGLVLTRIGCLLQGCNYGKVTDLPWGVQFPPGSEAYQLHLGLGRIEPGAPYSLAVHPTQIYESLFGLFLLAAALWLSPRRRFNGQVFMSTVMLYFAARFVFEFLRDDSGGVSFGALTFAQGTTLLLLPLSAGLYLYARRLGHR